MTYLLVSLLLACSPADPGEGGPSDTEDSSDTGPVDTGDPVESPEGWPDPWGVVTMGLGCLELDGTELEDEASRAQAVAGEVLDRGIAVLALQEVCRDDGGGDALGLLHGALEAASGASWSSSFQPTSADGGRERGIALLARGGLEEPFAIPYVQQGGDDRWLLGARVDAGPVVFTTQLDDADADLRQLQARSFAAVAVGSTAPSLELLLAGDFADENRSSAVWAQTGAGFVEDSAEQDDDRRHILHHRASSWSAAASATLFDGASGPAVAPAPGIAAWYGPAVGGHACITELVVEVSVDAGHWVALRGTDFPLDWSFGQPAWERSPGTWAWVSSEIQDAPFEYKALLDDATWQVGEDIEGVGCTSNSTTPTWEEPDDAVDPRVRR